MTWELKPEAREANYAAQSAELAPAPENYDDASDEDPTASGMDGDEMHF